MARWQSEFGLNYGIAIAFGAAVLLILSYSSALSVTRLLHFFHFIELHNKAVARLRKRHCPDGVSWHQQVRLFKYVEIAGVAQIRQDRSLDSLRVI